MATVNLNPESLIATNWSNTSDCVTSHNRHASATVLTQYIRIRMEDLPSAASSINSIRLYGEAYVDTRGASGVIRFTVGDSGANYYYDDLIFSDREGVEAGANKTTYDGSNAWTVAIVNDLRVEAKLTVLTAGTMLLDHFYVTVDYNTGYSNKVHSIAAASISKVVDVASSTITKVIGT